MTISNSNLSNWIAEKLEPLEPLLKRRPKPGYLMISDGLCWQADATHHWRARDMVNDPAMTVMLLGQLLDLEDFSDILIQKHHGRFTSGRTGVHAQARELGRAIAENFAIAHGMQINE